MKLKVDGDKLTCLEDTIIRAKTIDIYDIEIEFSNDWNEFTTKTIIYSNR